MINDKLTILVSTCYNFSDLWNNNKILFERYWKNSPQIVFFTDNIGDFKYKNFLTFANLEFSSRLIRALEQIKTKYVLLTLDDYLLCDTVHNKKILNLLDFMEKNNADYMRIFKYAKVKGSFFNPSLKVKKIEYKRKAYEVNLYPGLWKTDSLRRIIIENENIWKFEVRLNRRCRENGLNAFCTYDKKVYPFIDTIRKGKYLRSSYDFLKKNKLFISGRKKRSVIETICLNVKRFIFHLFPEKCIQSIKKIFHLKNSYSNMADSDD